MPDLSGNFFTARELAEIVRDRGLTNFPSTERNIRAHAKRAGWEALPDTLVRRRPSGAQGGRTSWEYHFSLLPEALQAAIASRQAHASLRARHDLRAEADRRRVQAIGMSALGQGPRRAMEARAEILTAIDGYATAHHQSRAWAIARFLAAQDHWQACQEIQARRDAGEILTEAEAEQLAQVPRLIAPRTLDLYADYGVEHGGFGLSPATLEAANDRRKSPVVKRSAVYDWFKARGRDGVLALAPVPPKAEAPIPPAFADFLKFYALPGKPTAADAHRQWAEACDGGTPPMSLQQVRYILRNRLNNIEKHVGREGLLTLRARLPFVTRTTEGMWPTTIYTADGKTLDAEVADPVSHRPMKPEITSILDVATRRCVGVAVSRKEGVIAVTEALRRASCAHGIPAIFYTDRGPGYKNKVFDADVGGLMGRLGITKMHALPYNSQAKGLVERFQALWNDVARRLPTYLGADMDKEAKQVVHKETRAEIREFGRARRLPTWDDLLALIDATAAAYNDRPHAGLPKFEDPETGRMRHMSPNEAWAAHVAAGFEPVPVDAAEADDLWRPYEIRTASRGLVQFNTNSYFHAALEPYHGEKVWVGYDFAQADKVWVREFDVSTGQPGRLICVADFEGNAQRYVPVSVEQKAIEDRAKARLKRLERKIDDVEAERDGVAMLDHETPAPFFDAALAEPAAEPVALAIDNDVEEPAAMPATPRRRVFASDEELALWALDHPDDVTPGQIGVLRECLASPSARELFRMSGIDLEALRTLLRDAA
ncbi:Transposase [Rhodovulum sp. P5]|uniref:Mu transposase C-terminal domain-containing protein n=1 Tax=Rhodovulum sp. P5 TaxID=1564506 RepID=UPI0009C33F35|nr:Mu transposase C-terminal domain-containing protein [Rhodovulum sp. P5]ARE40877.1 Transposase [Rhodovulum sp. P5]